MAAPARAAVTIGPDPLPQRTGVVGEGGAKIFTSDAIPGAAVASPIDGVVVRWRVRRGSGGGGLTADTITLRILRSTGMLNEFTAIGTSEPHEVPGGSVDPVDVYEYPTSLPIAAGDRIGLGTSEGKTPYREETGASYLVRVNPLADGETATFGVGAFPDLYVLVNADVEADCDGDGLGDETQDPMIPPVASCGFLPPAGPSAPTADTIAPVGSKLRFAPQRFRPKRKRSPSVSTASAKKRSMRSRRTSRVSYRLSEDARARFFVQRRVIGRKKGKRCLIGKRARRLPKARKCRRFVRVKGAFSHTGKQGTNRFRFSGYVRGRRLKPGVYRMVGVPTDAAGNRGGRVGGSFVIAR
jgi:hypothetical protein